LKILVLTSSYPKFAGDGTAPFVDSIVRGIAALGHEMHVLVPDHRAWAWPENDESVSFHRYRYSPLRSWTPWGFSESLSGSGIRKTLYPLAPVVVASAARKARRLLAKGGFDIVNAHWVVPNGPIARLAAGTTPLVVSLHGSDMAVAERSRSLGRAAAWTFERAAAVTAPSTDLVVRAKALGARSPVRLVPYGADAAAFDASPAAGAAVRARVGVGEGEILVVGVGRLLPVKGFDVLLDAFAIASRQDGRIRLVLVGDGPERSELTGRLASLGVTQGARLVGAVDHKDIPAYLAAADVVAVPSVRRGPYVDGLPNVALEAMAAGRPLVATRVGGLPDLVEPGETGLLVEENDADALANALLTLAGDPVLRARLGSSAQHEIREHRSWSSVARSFVDTYEAALRDR
jgi:phosphatidyl-myo-inositol dimannoside synthase